jgi:hypothetical protein
LACSFDSGVAVDVNHADIVSLETVTQAAASSELILLQEQSTDTEVDMSASMVAETTRNFIRLASRLQTSGADSIAVVRLAKTVLGEGDTHTERGGGLALIFRKLNEMTGKIEEEQAIEKDQNDQDRDNCQTETSAESDTITECSARRAQNTIEIQDLNTKIRSNNLLWVQSRSVEDKTNVQLKQLEADRYETSQLVAGQVDERNKAIDVMVAAAFLVCERFNRFKNTKQCKEIRAQPNVQEPARYPTRDYKHAKEETERTHISPPGASPDDIPAWLQKWTNRLNRDKAKEGKIDPEGLFHDHFGGSNSTQDLLEDTMLGEDTSALSLHEEAAYHELVLHIRKAELSQKYAVPLNQLAIDLKSGQRAGRKSILQVLLGVLKEVRDEQATAKAEHTKRLDEWYAQIWALMKMLKDQAADQFRYRETMETSRVRILELMEVNERDRKDQNNALATRTTIENRCALSSEEYGVRESIRLEDLENIRKLKSLLRGLYEKKMPKACKKHNGVICSSFDQGWCVYMQESKADGDDQECSCNPGFYGEMCQFRMCPGFGKTLYAADADGVCSNRGKCDRLKGYCTCHAEFYHGPKNACDYKHAPASKSGKIDNKCSDGRGALDKIRGTCACGIEYFGPGCEQKRCPNKNGVLYPAVSANACTGHGACSTETGTCTCKLPYRHGSKRACEEEHCPEACRGRGDCNYATGACTCSTYPKKERRFNAASGKKLQLKGTGFHGHACEFHFCPTLIEKDCSGGGTCNRNTGLCVCREGYSGPVCANTHRCTAAPLHNSKMNWWTVWDKPGWLVCPQGQLLYKLKRSQCASLADPKDSNKPSSFGGALSCIESGGCAAPCEQVHDVAQIRHCYHDLRWYNSFDTKGWSKCLDDYFIAGLYRSCESLYCLNMAKCCSLKDSRWALCGETRWGAEFNGESDSQLVGQVPKDSFITGFKRNDVHTLAGITHASFCQFVRDY